MILCLSHDDRFGNHRVVHSHMLNDRGGLFGDLGVGFHISAIALALSHSFAGLMHVKRGVLINHGHDDYSAGRRGVPRLLRWRTT